MPIKTYEVTLDDGRIVEVDVEDTPTANPPMELPTTMGFLGNVLSSGAKFATDIIEPAFHPVDTIKGLATAISEPTLTGKLIRDAAIKRYGSVDAFLNTLYTDPVGAASDASILIGGAASAAKATGAMRGATRMGQMAEALNPLAIPAKAAETGGRALYGAAINPSRRIRRGFPGVIDEGYAIGVLPTEGGLARTERALEQSADKTQGLLLKADLAGAPGVNVRTQIAPSLAPPMKEARRRARLGVADETGDVATRARVMVGRNTQPIPLSEANELKRSAQTLADNAFRARERGALIKDLDALANEQVARAYRRAIEVNAASVGVNGIAESNRKTQALIGLAQALEDATQQPSRLTHLMSTLGGVGGGLAGGPATGATAYAVGRAVTAKPIMALVGLGVGKSGKRLRDAQILRALSVLGAQREGATEDQQQ